MGALVEGQAIEAEKAGRKHTAGDYYLRAGNYLYNAERFLRPGPEKRAAGERAFRAYHAGIRLRHPNIERVEVPVRGHDPAGAVHEGCRRRAARRPSSSSTAWTTARR